MKRATPVPLQRAYSSIDLNADELPSRPITTTAATQTPYYYDSSSPRYLDTSVNSGQTNSAVYYINQTPSLYSYTTDPPPIVSESTEVSVTGESVQKLLLRLFHIFSYILRWLVVIFQIVFIVILFSNGWGWYNLFNVASLAAFLFAHMGVFNRTASWLYAFFILDFIVIIFYVVFAILLLADANYYNYFQYPTYLYRMTVVDQEVIGFCLLLSSTFMILFIVVIGRVWWGRPFCYPQKKGQFLEDDYTGRICFGQVFGCFRNE
ncbi:unnamed protein product [Bursaphelenchus xylophilus]|uniref:(pine wood nematode) hypothetical protein n=1 Tax=Bursaphelenchus xylophilus TaxID=6326 RepID=A0A1I7RMH9_BURXY|nr:unnamed protein product [Bursaphelenchus xylophilus]CAG9118508.1 unnamed protein product [Bursaphelenchus xylophilus]